MNIFYFDIDGTLLDVDKKVVLNIWKESIAHNIGSYFRDNSIQGSTDYKILSSITENNPEKVKIVRDRYIAKHSGILQKKDITVKKGVKQFLDCIGGSGKLNIVTGNFHENAILKLKLSGLISYFDNIYTCEKEVDKTAILSKSKLASMRNEITSQIYFGDTWNDKIAAEKNNMKFIQIGQSVMLRNDHIKLGNYLNININDIL